LRFAAAGLATAAFTVFFFPALTALGKFFDASLLDDVRPRLE